MRKAILVLALVLSSAVGAQQQPNPRQRPGAMVTLFAPEQHDLYDGRFVISANRIYMVGGLNDAPGWDHMDNEAKNVRPVSGTAEIDVNEIQNTGQFEAKLKVAEGDLVLAMDRWNEFNPCQNGGIVAYQDYEVHFMVTQGIRDRKTLRVNYPMPNKKLAAGEVNPATQQIDFYIRSPKEDKRNRPAREIFMHFFGMEVTWK